MTKRLLTLLLLCSAVLGYGQGWERIYSGGGQDEARDIVSTPDGGYVMTGLYGNNRISIIKVDADGFLQWSKNIFGDLSNPGLAAAGSAIVVTNDQKHYLIGGYRENQPFLQSKHKNAYLLKTDLSGNTVWSKDIGLAKDDEITDLIELPNNNIVVCGYRTGSNDVSDVWAALLDPSGNIIWSKTAGQTDRREVANAMALAANGDLVLAGEQRDAPTIKDIYVVRLDINNGDVVWENTYSLGTGTDDSGSGITATPDGHFVIAGYTQPPAQPTRGALLKIDATGSPIPLWFRQFPNTDNLNDVAVHPDGGLVLTGFTSLSAVLIDLFVARTDEDGILDWATLVGKPGADVGYAVMPTPDGGTVSVGLTSSSNLAGLAQYAYMIKTDRYGNIFTSYLGGRLFNDLNQSGVKDNNEPGIKKWLIEFRSPDYSRYVTTNNSGEYFILADTGTYQVKVFAPNDYWAVTNASNLIVPVTTFYDTIETDFGAYAAFACPHNEVDIQTPILRRCANNTYTVRYCNTGTEPSPSTTVSVDIDPALTITSSSAPYTLQGQKAVFEVGLLSAGDCRSFTFEAFLDCNTTTGQAFCTSAHIFPDSVCNTAPWDGAVIEALARCENDSVWLSLVNRGGAPLGSVLDYVIIEDVIMLTVPAGQISDLAPMQEDVVFNIPANGRTYRIIAEQPDGYPGLSLPTAAVEGCRTDTTSAESSLGFFTMFPEDDNEPFIATDCQESYEADFNPTFLKRGHPKGYDRTGESFHYVEAGTDLSYLIRFQNTTGNTVNQVIVRDTLSQWLNPVTVEPGSASHPYDYSLYGAGIVQFAMTNINLAPGAEGYVKFRVSQRENIPTGTQIWNTAQVYLDFNAPEGTNTTLHTIGDIDSFVITSTKDITGKGASVRVYPNPFFEQATFEVVDVPADVYRLELYDLQGRLLFNQAYTSATIQLFRHQIPTAGMLLYRLSADGKPVASGQIARIRR